MNVKINNQNYVVPELNFAHSKRMEQLGLPIKGMVSDGYFFTAISVFTSIVADCTPDEADRLIEQHVLGGGNVQDIYEAYVSAVKDSGFFKKLLKLDTQGEKTTKKVSEKRTETNIE